MTEPDRKVTVESYRNFHKEPRIQLCGTARGTTLLTLEQAEALFADLLAVLETFTDAAAVERYESADDPEALARMTAAARGDVLRGEFDDDGSPEHDD